MVGVVVQPRVFVTGDRTTATVADLLRETRHRVSLAPAGVALLLGLLLHALYQAVSFRAGPVPILVAAPVVATLTYLHVSEATYRRLLALLAWGVVATGTAVLGLYLLTVNDSLPRPMSGLEMLVYDLGMFLWFVFALAGVYAEAARSRARRAVLALLFGPVLQTAFVTVMWLLVAVGRFG